MNEHETKGERVISQHTSPRPRSASMPSNAHLLSLFYASLIRPGDRARVVASTRARGARAPSSISDSWPSRAFDDAFTRVDRAFDDAFAFTRSEQTHGVTITTYERERRSIEYGARGERVTATRETRATRVEAKSQRAHRTARELDVASGASFAIALALFASYANGARTLSDGYDATTFSAKRSVKIALCAAWPALMASETFRAQFIRANEESARKRREAMTRRDVRGKVRTEDEGGARDDANEASSTSSDDARSR